jgi:hypothetical protein
METALKLIGEALQHVPPHPIFPPYPNRGYRPR